MSFHLTADVISFHFRVLFRIAGRSCFGAYYGRFSPNLWIQFKNGRFVFFKSKSGGVCFVRDWILVADARIKLEMFMTTRSNRLLRLIKTMAKKKEKTKGGKRWSKVEGRQVVKFWMVEEFPLKFNNLQGRVAGRIFRLYRPLPPLGDSGRKDLYRLVATFALWSVCSPQSFPSNV